MLVLADKEVGIAHGGRIDVGQGDTGAADRSGLGRAGKEVVDMPDSDRRDTKAEHMEQADRQAQLTGQEKDLDSL